MSVNVSSYVHPELSLRGLPLWYQLLVAVTPIVTVTSLWLTNQIDPGIVPPSPNGEKGEMKSVGNIGYPLSSNDLLPNLCFLTDAIVELLDEGHTDITDYEKYGKDAKGRWTRAVLTEDGYKDHEKYCVICNVWRPRRGYHCDSCGHCMVRKLNTVHIMLYLRSNACKLNTTRVIARFYVWISCSHMMNDPRAYASASPL